MLHRPPGERRRRRDRDQARGRPCQGGPGTRSGAFLLIYSYTHSLPPGRSGARPRRWNRPGISAIVATSAASAVCGGKGRCNGDLWRIAARKQLKSHVRPVGSTLAESGCGAPPDGWIGGERGTPGEFDEVRSGRFTFGCHGARSRRERCRKARAALLPTLSPPDRAPPRRTHPRARRRHGHHDPAPRAG